MEKISVIVPVYNVENYLDECVDSIVNQTYHELEIILVDDGSTDTSGQKCDKWAEKDKRITVIHKENGGLADARNAGMRVATGSYIGFVDSDDWIDKRMYETLYNVINKYGINLALCQYKRVQDGGRYDLSDDDREYVFTGRSLLQHIFENKSNPYVANSVWKFLYKRSIVENLSFPKGRLYEDVLFTTNVLWKEEKVVVCAAQLYFYRIRANSIMRKEISDKNADDIFAYCDGLFEFYGQNASDSEMAYLRESLLWNNIEFRCDIKAYENDSNLSNRFDEYRRAHGLNYSAIRDKSIRKIVKYFLCIGPRPFCAFYKYLASKKRMNVKNV